MIRIGRKGMAALLAVSCIVGCAAAADEPATRGYIVQLREPGALAARSPAGGKVARLDARSAALGARLAASHDQLLQSVGAAGSKLYSYRLTFNGFAAEIITNVEARNIRKYRIASRILPVA